MVEEEELSFEPNSERSLLLPRRPSRHSHQVDTSPGEWARVGSLLAAGGHWTPGSTEAEVQSLHKRCLADMVITALW